MNKIKIGVLGATGAVGREMVKVLAERSFPLSELRLLASERSVGTKINFNGSEITVQKADENSFIGLDIVLGAVSNEFAKKFAPFILKAGCVFIDNSSAFRMDENTPLVVPEINPADAYNHNGIIANPNCSTIIALMAVNKLNAISPIRSMVVSTYQAVSGAGAGGPIELDNQLQGIFNGKKSEIQVFQHQIAYNLIPHIGSFCENGYTTEEMKMQNESRKILHLPDLTVSCTCVRVPITRSHSISINAVFESKITVEQAQQAIKNADGCVLADEPEKNLYPMPLIASDQNLVYVGRIRKDLTNENGLTLFCCGDQIRKGAATNAVQIAELLLK
ncbi:MAG TPA: aspartate-semialdehyde dehydrogenase [Clostridia bacterium]|nr:aspartate-semialdehyde dehydrogenase [Clostridia bacterium]